jgi:hypothetical protein
MRSVEKIADAEAADEADESARLMSAQYVYAQQLLQAKHENEIKIMVHAQDLKRSEHSAKGKIEVGVAERRVENLKRQVTDASDPAKVWNLFHRHDRGGEGKTAAAGHGNPAPCNPFRLSLPPLQGPHSARRLGAAKKNATFQ